MRALARRILFLGLAIVFAAEHAYGDVQGSAKDYSVNDECNKRRLLRFQQMLNLYFR